MLLLLSGCASKKPHEIAVYKSARQMVLIHDDKVYETYDIALGQNPIGHKEQEGDSRTPEGTYWIEGRNPESKYFLSLRVSYPDAKDIANAEDKGVPPGSDIMIHGMRGLGSRKDFLKAGDWTEGCIAVTNEEIQELWHLVELGTPITIYP